MYKIAMRIFLAFCLLGISNQIFISWIQLYRQRRPF